MSNHFYFAYGSNLNIEQMRRRCPGAEIVGTARLLDYQLAFRGSKTGSYLTVIPEDGGIVPIGVWRVSDADLDALDRYEGFPQFYGRRIISLQVNTDRGSMFCRGIIYIMRGDRDAGAPSRHYLEVCRQGYADFGFRSGPLDEAVKPYKEVMSYVG